VDLDLLSETFVLDSPPNDVGDRAKEISVIGGEPASTTGVHTEDPVRTFPIGDDHTHAADDAVVDEKGRGCKSRLRSNVVDENRFFDEQRVSGLRVLIARDGRLAYAHVFGPSLPGDKDQAFTGDRLLQNLGVVNVEDRARQIEREIKQVTNACASERGLTQLGDRRLS